MCTIIQQVIKTKRSNSFMQIILLVFYKYETTVKNTFLQYLYCKHYDVLMHQNLRH